MLAPNGERGFLIIDGETNDKMNSFCEELERSGCSDYDMNYEDVGTDTTVAVFVQISW